MILSGTKSGLVHLGALTGCDHVSSQFCLCMLAILSLFSLEIKVLFFFLLRVTPQSENLFTCYGWDYFTQQCRLILQLLKEVNYVQRSGLVLLHMPSIVT